LGLWKRVPRDQTNRLLAGLGKQRLGLLVEVDTGDAQTQSSGEPDTSDKKIIAKMNIHEILSPRTFVIFATVVYRKMSDTVPSANRASLVVAAMVTAHEADVIKTRTPVA